MNGGNDHDGDEGGGGDGLIAFGQFRMRNSIFQILKIEDYFKTMTVKIACWVSN